MAELPEVTVRISPELERALQRIRESVMDHVPQAFAQLAAQGTNLARAMEQMSEPLRRLHQLSAQVGISAEQADEALAALASLQPEPGSTIVTADEHESPEPPCRIDDFAHGATCAVHGYSCCWDEHDRCWRCNFSDRPCLLPWGLTPPAAEAYAPRTDEAQPGPRVVTLGLGRKRQDGP